MNKNITSYLLLYENYCQNRNAPSKQLSLILIPLCLSPPKQHRFLKPKQSLILIPLCYFSPLFQYPYAFKGYEIRGPKIRKYRGRRYNATAILQNVMQCIWLLSHSHDIQAPMDNITPIYDRSTETKIAALPQTSLFI